MIITQTPLRISLAGGGTDFRDYYSIAGTEFISTAIDKYVFVIIKERFDDLIVLNYTDREIVEQVDSISHDLIREAMRVTGVEKGVEITTLADIPSQGCGLGSSSSITVGLLNACYAHQGILVTAEQLAREAVMIEVETLGRPIGIQDQYIAAYGNLRHFRVSSGGEVESDPLAVPEQEKRRLEKQLSLWYLNATRSAADILVEQKQNIPDRIEVLDRMRSMVPDVRQALETGDFGQIGQSLDAGWDLKRGLAGAISNPAIDGLYEEAKKAGALGGKVVGAGGGGFLLLYTPGSMQERLRVELDSLRELPFKLEQDGSKVIFNVRRYSTK